MDKRINLKLGGRLGPLLFALIFLFSLLCLGYAYLQFGIVKGWEEASRLEREGRVAEALQEYEELAAFLKGVPLLTLRFGRVYSQAMVAQLRLLYAQEEYGKVIDLAERCIQEGIPDQGQVYYWSGNAYFMRGVDVELGEDSYSWFNRAQAQYRKGLEVDPEAAWDLRFNYELVTAILEMSDQNQDTRPLQLLRPDQDQLPMPTKKIEG